MSATLSERVRNGLKAYPVIEGITHREIATIHHENKIMPTQYLSITNEDLELYSPYTGLPCVVNGNVNDKDASLIYVYVEEIEDFEYIKKGIDKASLTSPQQGGETIDLVIELDDTIAGGNVFIGYRQLNN